MPTSPKGTDAAPGPSVGAIVVAAGESRRMGDIDKIFAPIGDQPMIWHALQTLQNAREVRDIVLVLSAHNLERGRSLVAASGFDKVRDVCAGGERRQDSVRRGLDRLSGSEWIIVHDGARPFVSGEMIATGLAEARSTGAAAAAVPVKDTIKSADERGFVEETLPRDTLWAAQTPQVFRRQLLAEAHSHVSEDATDDAAMVERVGGKVRLFQGSYDNIKVTTPEDLAVAEAILRRRQSSGYGSGE